MAYTPVYEEWHDDPATDTPITAAALEHIEAGIVAAAAAADDAQGTPGADGADGASAYEVAVAAGFAGTEAEWLASLVGADGADGEQGPPGADGQDGADGHSPVITWDDTTIVVDGTPGPDLQGPQGEPGADGEQGPPGEPPADVVTSETVSAIVAITQAAYDALPTPRDAAILYVVTG